MNYGTAFTEHCAYPPPICASTDPYDTSATAIRCSGLHTIDACNVPHSRGIEPSQCINDWVCYGCT